MNESFEVSKSQRMKYNYIHRLDGQTTLSENFNEIYSLGSYDLFDNLYSNYNSVSFYHLNMKKLKFEKTMQTRDIKTIYVSDANVNYKL